MNVPLDHLYHYLDNITDHDLVIYRWYPHGSKKLENLMTLREYSDFYVMICPQLIFHDQEPLNFDYYTPEKIFDAIKSTITNIGGLPNAEFEKYLVSISENNICTYLTSFNLYDKVLLVHSEKNSQDLKKYTAINTVPVYYWSHALIARDWYRYANIDPVLQNRDNNFEFDFLVYSRAWTGTREYRLKFVEMIVNENLDKKSFINFSAVQDELHYSDYKFSNKNLSISNTNLEKYFNSNTASSDSSADYCALDYQQCGFEVVLETLFDDCRLHLTEKSLRPIACGVPFILAATAGSLEYLRSYGFKTFGEYINEEYDTIVDPVQRLTAIIKLMKEITELSKEQKQQLHQDLREICLFNQRRFFSQEFFQEIVQEYQSNLNTGLSQLKMQHNSIEREMPFKKMLFHNRNLFKKTKLDF
jgi:glycosyltransferase involved in cell wall biosynthesis